MKKNLLLLSFIILSANAALAQNKHLWATASDGGPSDDGTILMSDSSGTNWQVVAHFSNYNGSYPQGKLIIGPDGKIYGTTRRGGVSNSCIIYSLDTSSYLITNIYDFMSAPSQGAIPYSGITLTNNCSMYGVTFDGGSNSDGVIYYFDPSSGFYVDLYDFSTATGENPFGELLPLPNGLLYGMASGGGANGEGVIFSFDPLSFSYAVIHDFSYATGSEPAYGNLIQATNGKIYGMTKGGGINGDGVIFSYDLTTNTYTDLHDFNYSVDGTHPFGSLMQAANGKLYGMNIAGGTGGSGNLFSYDVSTATFSLLVPFNGANGDYPQRGLTQAANGKLYGTTMHGGLYDLGVIYSYDITTGTYTKLLDFDGATNGSNPTCDIFETGGIQTNPCLVGIPSFEQSNSVAFYPNPVSATNGNFIIQFNVPVLNGEIIIYDMHGQKIYSEKLNNSQTEWSRQLNAHLLSGMYILQINNGQRSIIKKLVVQ